MAPDSKEFGAFFMVGGCYYDTPPCLAASQVQLEPQAQVALAADDFCAEGWAWHPHEQAAPGQPRQVQEGVVGCLMDSSVW